MRRVERTIDVEEPITDALVWAWNQRLMKVLESFGKVTFNGPCDEHGALVCFFSDEQIWSLWARQKVTLCIRGIWPLAREADREIWTSKVITNIGEALQDGSLCPASDGSQKLRELRKRPEVDSLLNLLGELSDERDVNCLIEEHRFKKLDGSVVPAFRLSRTFWRLLVPAEIPANEESLEEADEA